MQAETSYSRESAGPDYSQWMWETREALVSYLDTLFTEKGTNPRAVSLQLGKSHTYMRDFMKAKGSPKSLPREVQEDLAKIFAVPEEQFRFRRSNVKDSAGISPYDLKAGNKSGNQMRGASGMSMADLYTKYGELRHRIELLEAQQRPEPQAKGKKRSRP